MTLRKVAATVAAAVVSAVVLAVGLATPAYAYTWISVDSPDGDAFASGAEVVVTGYNGSSSTQRFRVECSDADLWPVAAVGPGSFSVSVGTFTGPDTCEITDYADSFIVLATFTVSAPPTTVSEASVRSDRFYPLVRDDYQDSALFRWRQNGDGRATIAVVNSDGRTVRSARPWAWQGRNNWTWNGKNDKGNLVAKGRYRIEVTVDDNTVSARVTVATALVTKTRRIREEGNRADSFATRGSCYASRNSYEQIASLDCWGGRYARATYRLRIPADATDVRGTIDLRPSDADMCCHGRITKGWSRSSERSVTFWAKVTNLRATEVNFVRVVYKTKVRI